MKKDKLDEILRRHQLWRDNKDGGSLATSAPPSAMINQDYYATHPHTTMYNKNITITTFPARKSEQQN